MVMIQLAVFILLLVSGSRCDNIDGDNHTQTLQYFVDQLMTDIRSEFLKCAVKWIMPPILDVLLISQRARQLQLTEDGLPLAMISLLDEEDVMRFVCGNMNYLDGCVMDVALTSKDPTDLMIMDIVNPLELVTRFGEIYCQHAHQKEVTESFPCLMEHAQVVGCGAMWQNIQNIDSTQYKDMAEQICPEIGSILKCLEIQAERCSLQMASTLGGAENLLTSHCRALSDQEHPDDTIAFLPLHSAFIQCASGMLSQIQGIVQEPPEVALNKGIGIVCGEKDFYLTCVAREVPKSGSSIDRLFGSFLDLSSVSRLNEVITPLCRAKSQIQNVLPCMMGDEAVDNTFACLGEVETQFQKMLNVSVPVGEPESTRLQYCGSLSKFIHCETDVMSKCDAELAHLAHYSVLGTLRVDCGGYNTAAWQGVTGTLLGVVVVLEWLLHAVLH